MNLLSGNLKSKSLIGFPPKDYESKNEKYELIICCYLYSLSRKEHLRFFEQTNQLIPQDYIL